MLQLSMFKGKLLMVGLRRRKTRINLSEILAHELRIRNMTIMICVAVRCYRFAMEKILLCNIPMLSATFEPENVRNDLMVQESSGEPSLWNRVSAIADVHSKVHICSLRCK
jgi:hypothetical protein